MQLINNKTIEVELYNIDENKIENKRLCYYDECDDRNKARVYLCLMLSGTKIFHQECRFCRLYSIGGESSLIELPFKSSISLSSITDELMLLGFDEFLRRRRSIFVCHVDERRRLSLSGVDVNNDCRRGEQTAIGGDDDNGDCVCSFSSLLPFAIKSSSAKSQNFGVPLLSFSLWLFCSLDESRFSLATAVSYDASLFCRCFIFVLNSCFYFAFQCNRGEKNEKKKKNVNKNKEPKKKKMRWNWRRVN